MTASKRKVQDRPCPNKTLLALGFLTCDRATTATIYKWGTMRGDKTHKPKKPSTYLPSHLRRDEHTKLPFLLDLEFHAHSLSGCFLLKSSLYQVSDCWVCAQHGAVSSALCCGLVL